MRVICYFCNCPFWMKYLLYWTHCYGFSSAWVLRCLNSLQFEWRIFHTESSGIVSGVVSLRCAFFDDFLRFLIQWMLPHTKHTCMVSLLCGFFGASVGLPLTEGFATLNTLVCSLMLLQVCLLTEGCATRNTLVWFLSGVSSFVLL